METIFDLKTSLLNRLFCVTICVACCIFTFFIEGNGKFLLLAFFFPLALWAIWWLFAGATAIKATSGSIYFGKTEIPLFDILDYGIYGDSNIGPVLVLKVINVPQSAQSWPWWTEKTTGYHLADSCVWQSIAGTDMARLEHFLNATLGKEPILGLITGKNGKIVD